MLGCAPESVQQGRKLTLCEGWPSGGSVSYGCFKTISLMLLMSPPTHGQHWQIGLCSDRMSVSMCVRMFSLRADAPAQKALEVPSTRMAPMPSSALKAFKALCCASTMSAQHTTVDLSTQHASQPIPMGVRQASVAEGVQASYQLTSH